MLLLLIGHSLLIHRIQHSPAKYLKKSSNWEILIKTDTMFLKGHSNVKKQGSPH